VFLRVSVLDLGGSGAGFAIISGKWGLIGVPPPSPLSGYTSLDEVIEVILGSGGVLMDFGLVKKLVIG